MPIHFRHSYFRKSCSTFTAAITSWEPDFKTVCLTKLTSSTIVLSLTDSPASLAIPFLNSPSTFTPTTPFSQSQNLELGLENGKIRQCRQQIQKLRDAILKTQKNVQIQAIGDTKLYLQVEIDGTFGRDVLEFLVKGDAVSYRTMTKKVTFVYPFTSHNCYR